MSPTTTELGSTLRMTAEAHALDLINTCAGCALVRMNADAVVAQIMDDAAAATLSCKTHRYEVLGDLIIDALRKAVLVEPELEAAVSADDDLKVLTAGQGFNCDNCGCEWKLSERWGLEQPDAAGMSTEVLWFCPNCGPLVGYAKPLGSEAVLPREVR